MASCYHTQARNKSPLVYSPFLPPIPLTRRMRERETCGSDGVDGRHGKLFNTRLALWGRVEGNPPSIVIQYQVVAESSTTSLHKFTSIYRYVPQTNVCNQNKLFPRPLSPWETTHNLLCCTVLISALQPREWRNVKRKGRKISRIWKN